MNAVSWHSVLTNHHLYTLKFLLKTAKCFLMDMPPSLNAHHAKSRYQGIGLTKEKFFPLGCFVSSFERLCSEILVIDSKKWN